MKTKVLTRAVRKFLRESKAATTIEYAILVGVIVVAAATLLGTFHAQITTAIQAIATNIGTTTATVGQ